MDRVLIVDDDEDTLLIVTEIARVAGYEPVAASNFPQAREALMLGVSAVLLDIVMPDQLCVRLSAYMAEDHRNTPLILMSAGSTEFIRKTAKQLEAIGVRVTGTLVKPFWVDGLLEVLSRATSDPEPGDGYDASAWLPDSAPTD